ncbi:SsrA-binding protein SmpB [Candidatus Dojkabacteria bacterium]|nr:SsrA-binding protein SmpB [Candidatus Dojkabacteria bacterium]
MKTYAQNKKAYFNYSISEEMEAGIVLEGWEVKSIKKASASIKESFVKYQKGELFLVGMHVAKWKQTGKEVQMDEIRDRKLLLSKKEINKLIGGEKREGYSIVPTKVYDNGRGIIKISIGLGKGKKKYDKRAKLKEMDQKKQIDRDLRGDK